MDHSGKHNDVSSLHAGLLEPVQNLTANQINRTAFTLQYKHPQSLVGVPFLYTIRISSDDGATDKEVNTTEDEFHLVTNNWCPVYEINITSVNGAGEGGTNAISLTFMNGTHTIHVYTTKLHW